MKLLRTPFMILVISAFCAGSFGFSLKSDSYYSLFRVASSGIHIECLDTNPVLLAVNSCKGFFTAINEQNLLSSFKKTDIAGCSPDAVAQSKYLIVKSGSEDICVGRHENKMYDEVEQILFTNLSSKEECVRYRQPTIRFIVVDVETLIGDSESFCNL